MLTISRNQVFNKSESLEKAGKALVKGKIDKAIVEYKKILEADPDNFVIRGKVAPLYAEQNKMLEAWTNFKASAHGYSRAGFVAKALGVYAQATQYLPNELELWDSIARIQLEKGMKVDAIETLNRASENFSDSKSLNKAVYLLKKAFNIQPWHYDTTLSLADDLSRVGSIPAKVEAIGLYTGLADRVKGPRLRVVRYRHFKASPGFGTFWRYLKSVFKD